jgi:hypothetical protein
VFRCHSPGRIVDGRKTARKEAKTAEKVPNIDPFMSGFSLFRLNFWLFWFNGLNYWNCSTPSQDDLSYKVFEGAKDGFCYLDQVQDRFWYNQSRRKRNGAFNDAI